MSLRRTLVSSSIAGACVLAVGAPAALAATSQIWWSNYHASGSPNAIAYAGIDGSGATSLPLVTPEPDGPWGTALDLVNGRVFWFDIDSTGYPIWRANLDGSGQVKLGDTNASDPYGISYDQETNRLYYGEYYSGTHNTILWMSGDGTSQTPQTLYQGSHARYPWLATVDPSSDRVYWANYSSPYTIGWASRDGSQSGEIAQDSGNGCGVMGSGFYAYTVLPQLSKILWFNTTGRKVTETSIDGSDCHVLTTTGGTTDALAFDPRTNNVYYFDGTPGALHYFDLNNPSAAGDVTLPTSLAGSSAQFPIIAAAPTAKEVLLTSSGSGAATTLSCSATWYPGIPAASFYSAPSSATSYTWSLNGSPVAGATSSTLAPASNGSYTCTASASNSVGLGSQESNAIVLSDVPAPAPTPAPAPVSPTGGPSGSVTVPSTRRALGVPVTSSGTLGVTLQCPVSAVGGCDASGTLTLKTLPQSNAIIETALASKVVATFKGVEIAAGSQRLVTLRLAPATFAALKAAGVRRIPATLNTRTELANGDVVRGSQRIWLRIPVSRRFPAVTG